MRRASTASAQLSTVNCQLSINMKKHYIQPKMEEVTMNATLLQVTSPRTIPVRGGNGNQIEEEEDIW